jgi:hypothetical protein
MDTLQQLKDFASKSIEKVTLNFVQSSILGTVEQKLRSYGIVIPEGADKDTLGALYDIAVSASHQSDPKSAILNAAATQGISLLSRAILGDDDNDGTINILDEQSTAGSIAHIVSTAVSGKLHNIAHIEAPVATGQDGQPRVEPVQTPGIVSYVVGEHPGVGVSPASVNTADAIVNDLVDLAKSMKAPAKVRAPKAVKPPKEPFVPAQVRTTSPR